MFPDSAEMSGLSSVASEPKKLAVPLRRCPLLGRHGHRRQRRHHHRRPSPPARRAKAPPAAAHLMQNHRRLGCSRAERAVPKYSRHLRSVACPLDHQLFARATGAGDLPARGAAAMHAAPAHFAAAPRAQALPIQCFHCPRCGQYAIPDRAALAARFRKRAPPVSPEASDTTRKGLRTETMPQ